MADYIKVFDQPPSNPVDYEDYPDWVKTKTNFEMTTTGTGIGSVDGTDYDCFVYNGIQSGATSTKIVIDSFGDTAASMGIVVNANIDTDSPVNSTFLLVVLSTAGGLSLFQKLVGSPTAATSLLFGGGLKNTDTVAWQTNDELEIITKKVGKYITIVPVKNGVPYNGWVINPRQAASDTPFLGSSGIYAWNGTVPNFDNAIRSFEVTDLTKTYQQYPDTFLVRSTLNITSDYGAGGPSIGVVGLYGFPTEVPNGIPVRVESQDKSKFIEVFGIANIGDTSMSNYLCIASHLPLSGGSFAPTLDLQIRSVHLNGSGFDRSADSVISLPGYYVNNTFNYFLGQNPWTRSFGTPTVDGICEIIVEVDSSFLGLSGGGGGSGGGGDITPRHFAETLTGEKI
jgi:hypothetical protein